MCLIILTVYVSLGAVRSFEASGYDYSMRYRDILEELNVRVSYYLYIYLRT
jgi:neutral trehalase